MEDSYKKIILEKVRKILIPDFTNKLTWLLGSGGLALIVGPMLFKLIGTISTELFGVSLNFEFLSQDRSLLGALLCILAVIQNIAYQIKGSLSEYFALQENGRKHESETLAVKNRFKLDAIDRNAETGVMEANRDHDLKKVEEIDTIFPFSVVQWELRRAADIGISSSFHGALDEIRDFDTVDKRLYHEESEAARLAFVRQANETSVVLARSLGFESRFPDRFVPFYEQKHNGLREVFDASQREMHDSCLELIGSYENFIETLQKHNLWSINTR